MPYTNPLIVAIDTSDISEAIRLVGAVRPHVFAVKFGLELFLSHGAPGIHTVLDMVAVDEFRVTGTGQSHCPFMLDLKLHDIPSTVAAAVRAILPIRPWALTIWAPSDGGTDMMRAAVNAVRSAGCIRGDVTKVLAVTLLTSSRMNTADARATVEHLARNAMNAQCDGIVCAAPDITPALRRELGARLIVTPGIRSMQDDETEQQRVATPATAMELGADYIVVGRPITRASDPAAAAQHIVKEALGR